MLFAKNPPAGRFSCCFMSWKIHCYCHKELKPSNNTDKCFFSTLVLNILYYRSLFFSCHISVQKLSNHLVVPWTSKPDHISADFWKPLPWHPNITEFTFEGVTTHSLNLKLASTLIVLLFEVDTDIYLFYFKSDSKSYGLPISKRQ